MSRSYFAILPSNTSAQPLNRTNKFRIRLKKTLKFDGEWVCGVYSVMYPKSWTHDTNSELDKISIKLLNGEVVEILPTISSDKNMENFTNKLNSAIRKQVLDHFEDSTKRTKRSMLPHGFEQSEELREVFDRGTIFRLFEDQIAVVTETKPYNVYILRTANHVLEDDYVEKDEFTKKIIVGNNIFELVTKFDVTRIGDIHSSIAEEKMGTITATEKGLLKESMLVEFFDRKFVLAFPQTKVENFMLIQYPKKIVPRESREHVALWPRIETRKPPKRKHIAEDTLKKDEPELKKQRFELPKIPEGEVLPTLPPKVPEVLVEPRTQMTSGNNVVITNEKGWEVKDRVKFIPKEMLDPKVTRYEYPRGFVEMSGEVSEDRQTVIATLEENGFWVDTDGKIVAETERTIEKFLKKYKMTPEIFEDLAKKVNFQIVVRSKLQPLTRKETLETLKVLGYKINAENKITELDFHRLREFHVSMALLLVSLKYHGIQIINTPKEVSDAPKTKTSMKLVPPDEFIFRGDSSVEEKKDTSVFEVDPKVSKGEVEKIPETIIPPIVVTNPEKIPVLETAPDVAPLPFVPEPLDGMTVEEILALIRRKIPVYAKMTEKRFNERFANKSKEKIFEILIEQGYAVSEEPDKKFREFIKKYLEPLPKIVIGPEVIEKVAQTRFVFDREMGRFYLEYDPKYVNYVTMADRMAYVLGYEKSKKILRHQLAKYIPDLNVDIHQLFIYENSGLTENMIVGDKLTSLLRIVNVEAEDGQVKEVIYTHPIFKRVIAKEINEIELEIKTSHNQYVPFNYGNVIVTLFFQKLSIV